MDLLFVSDVLPYPLRDPARVLLYYLGRELYQRRHVIDLVSFYHDPGEIADSPRYEQFFFSMHMLPRPAFDWRLLEHRAEHDQLTTRSAAQMMSPDMWGALRDLVSTKRYSAVQLIGSWPLYDYSPLLRNLPTLFTVRHMPEATQTPQTRSQRRRHALYTQYEKHSLGHFGALGALENDVQAALVERQGLETRLLPVGVDVDYYVATGYDPDPPALCFMGDFAQSRWRVAARLIFDQILPAVRTQIPDVRFYLVG
ncbi:MAG: hypothetical protein ACLFTK_07695, partial [Anaerolineales bacterium]